MIDVKNLEKSFEGHQVLKGINEHIYKGEKAVSYTHLDVYKRQGQVRETSHLRCHLNSPFPGALIAYNF